MSFSVHKPNIFRQSIHTWSKQQESLSDRHLPTCPISIHCLNRSLLHTQVFKLVNSCFGYQTPTCCSAFSSRAFFLQHSDMTNLLQESARCKKRLCLYTEWSESLSSFSGVFQLSFRQRGVFSPPLLTSGHQIEIDQLQMRSHVLKLHLVWELVHADRLSTDCLCVCPRYCRCLHPHPPPTPAPLSVARTQ